jgi:hypothetical protein
MAMRNHHPRRVHLKSGGESLQHPRRTVPWATLDLRDHRNAGAHLPRELLSHEREIERSRPGPIEATDADDGRDRAAVDEAADDRPIHFKASMNATGSRPFRARSPTSGSGSRSRRTMCARSAICADRMQRRLEQGPEMPKPADLAVTGFRRV